MKLLLHIGQQKAGSTALQNSLYMNRALLSRHGMLYPDLPYYARNHGSLARLIFEEKRWPRHICNSERKRPGSVKEGAQCILRSIEAAKKTGEYHTVVLSSEYFFRRLEAHNREKLQKHLFSYFDEVQCICYIRHPADRYLSHSLQKVRHSGKIPQPPKNTFRPVIESYSSWVPVAVRPYHNDLLIRGDIIADFVQTFLCGLSYDEFAQSGSRDNTALPAEVASILQDYRHTVHPSDDDIIYPEDTHLAKTLSGIACEKGLERKAELKPSARQFIAQRAQEELEWLHDTYGIRFPRNDDHTDKEEKSPQKQLKAAHLCDICEIDEKIEKQLLIHTIAEQARRIIEDEQLIAQLRRGPAIRFLLSIKHQRS